MEKYGTYRCASRWLLKTALRFALQVLDARFHSLPKELWMLKTA